MKRLSIIAILITICGITAMAQDRPDLTHQTGGDDRSIHKIFVDMPTVVYDADAEEIIVEGSQSSYYTATITSQSTQMIEFETIIDGEYDIIDVSMLMPGTYTLTLTSSNDNSYSWTFSPGLGLFYNRASGKTVGIVTNVTLKMRE